MKEKFEERTQSWDMDMKNKRSFGEGKEVWSRQIKSTKIKLKEIISIVIDNFCVE